MEEQTPARHSRLPGPRWLLAAALALMLWGAGLLVWWSSLQKGGAETSSLPPSQPTSRPPVAATVQPSATPSAPLVLAPVQRIAGPIVRASNWLALANEFEAERALADIAELAGPRYAGRATGSPGSRLAAEWIADSFARYGLLPAGDAGTYFQEFSVPYAELTEMPTLDLQRESGETVKQFRLRTDYALWPGGYADGGQADAPVLWMGDGGAEQYRLVDAEGAVVVCRWQARLDNVQRQALEHGAAALLLFRPDYNMLMRRTAREEAILPQGLPTLIVGDSVVGALLVDSGLSLQDLPLQHNPRALPWRLRVDIPLAYDSAAVGRNVLGVLPGSDPDSISQTVIVGAHYDHLGADPDGTLWGGANDDASGVAVMLELARVWQEQGYVPERTVLFAAWDAEEIGLNGSEYYVEHPRLPLTSTVGMLQLDMVGAGKPTLLIEPHGLVADQSLASAALLGIRTAEAPGGGSDHVPFASAHVPATLYIWEFQSAPALPYHVPADNLGLIDRARLGDAGRLAGLVLTTLASDHEELEDLSLSLQNALDKRDEQAFLSLSSPQSGQWSSAVADWFQRLSADSAVSLTLRTDVPIVVGELATSTVTLQYRWEGSSSATPGRQAQGTAQFSALWNRVSGRWRMLGPAFVTATVGSTVVQSLGATNGPAVAAIAESLRGKAESELGAVLPHPLGISQYASAALLYALEHPPASSTEQLAWVNGDRLVIAQTSALTRTLLSLALAQTGWSPGQASWMSSALTERWSMSADEFEQLGERYIPVLLEANRSGSLWSPDQMPVAHAVPSGMQGIWDAQAWAMSRHVLDKDLLTREVVDLSGWRESQLSVWTEAEQGISQTLAARVAAVTALDDAAFLATVDPAKATLLQEERHWFADLHEHPTSEFSLDGQLLSLEGDSARVRVSMRYQLVGADTQPSTVTWIARFVQRGNSWLYSDLDQVEATSAHFLLSHDALVDAEFVQSLLDLAESGYDSVVKDLGIEPPLPVQIKLYADPAVFRTSIYLSMRQARGWNEPGESIKLTNLAGAEPGPIVAHELTHLLLFQLGIQHAGVHEGTAQWEAALAFPGWKYTRLRRWRQTVFDTIRSGRAIGLFSLADWDDWLTESELVYNIGWDNVDYLRRRSGRESFLMWLRCQGNAASSPGGGSVEWSSCFSSTLGVAYEAFDQQWRESVLRGHIPAEMISTALSFDGARSVDHVLHLSQPAWLGREVATSGNAQAVDYVADAFEEAGLAPLGDGKDYVQPFTVDVTRLAEVPTLIYRVGQPAASSVDTTRDVKSAFDTVTLTHLVDFREVLGGAAGGGTVVAGLAYAPTLPSDVTLGGRVLLTDGWQNIQQVARLASSQGAAAVLVKTNLLATDMAERSAVTLPQPSAIPVLELTEDAAEALLKAAGRQPGQAGQEPIAYALPISVSVSVELHTEVGASTANVLGVLPGSDPLLADELIIVSAQLDGVGSPPGDSIYPAANHNASGVAVLLELARLWHDSGYRPRRTVLFAAWNAGELGQQGSRYWLQSDLADQRKLRAVVHLDGVGQGRGFYLDVAGDDAQDAFILAGLDNVARQVEGRLNVIKYRPLGDDASFHNRGIPTVALSWERQEYSNTPHDTPDLIDEAKLQATGRIVALTLMTLADE